MAAVVPFEHHMTVLKVFKLVVGDRLDYADGFGKFHAAMIMHKCKRGSFKISFDNTSVPYDAECDDPANNIHRFAKLGSISQRAGHRFMSIRKGMFVDVNIKQHPGWRKAEIIEKDAHSGQIQVIYKVDISGGTTNAIDWIRWVHVDDVSQVALYGTYSSKTEFDHLSISLETKRSYLNTSNEIKELCADEIFETVYGGKANVLTHLIKNASTSELKQIQKIIKTRNIQYEERKKSATNTTTTTTYPLEECQCLLDKLKKLTYSKAFLEPVDWKQLNIPIYPQIIKHPMDLSTVQNKLNNDEYHTPYDFARDMRLIYQNAITFNNTQTPHYAAALKFAKQFEEEFERKIIDAHETNDFTRKIAKVIASLIKRDDSVHFLAPINPQVLEIPDYLDIIDVPMDLGTIMNKIHFYTQFKQFVHDLFLVWDNCCRYNPKYNQIHQTALKLREYTTKQLNGLCQSQWPKEHPSSSLTMKTVKITNDINNDKDCDEVNATELKISSLSQISRDCVDHICNYLDGEDIKSFKLTSFRNGMVALRQMTKCSVCVHIMNELFNPQNKNYMDMIDVMLTYRYDRYPANMKYLALRQIWQQKYDIPLSKQLLITYQTGSALIYDIDRNDKMNDTVIKHIPNLRFCLFDKRDTIILDKDTKSPKILDSSNINKEINRKLMILIKYFDIFTQEMIPLQILFGEYDLMTIGRLRKYVECEFLSTTSEQKVWHSKLLKSFKKMNNIDPYDQKLIVYTEMTNKVYPANNPMAKLPHRWSICIFQLNPKHASFSKRHFPTIQENYNLLTI